MSPKVWSCLCKRLGVGWLSVSFFCASGLLCRCACLQLAAEKAKQREKDEKEEAIYRWVGGWVGRVGEAGGWIPHQMCEHRHLLACIAAACCH